MLWDLALIERLLELYKHNRVLWDQKHPHYGDQLTRLMALKGIKEELNIHISPEDIHRKFRTMRAAYQVEVRNINAGKLRGFFYKPTLHWFNVFHKFTEETNILKDSNATLTKSKSQTKRVLPKRDFSGEAGSLPQRHSFARLNPRTIKKKPLRMRTQRQSIEIEIPVEDSRESSEMEFSSDEGEDEFQTFADHIAEQLRSMSVHRAVMIQNQIQRLFARDREMHEEEDFITI